MMIQTIALFLDAYRELNARKLFWITLAISVALVAAFAALGINERGVTFLWWTVEAPINTRAMPAAMFYKFAYAAFAIPIWLAWGASILGLVSTASIIPDFVASGSIELALSRPIGRVRLLLTKFAAALLFMLLQVAVFSAASFVVIGVRGDAWEPRLFLAVPIMVLFFSYLYAVCLLLGLLTRSTIASLLLTLLFWIGVFGVNATEGIFLFLKESNAARVAWLEASVQRLEKAPEQPVADADAERRAAQLERRRAQLAEARADGATARKGHAIVLAIKTVAPKTKETTELLNRALLSPQDRERFRRLQGGRDANGFGDGAGDVPVSPREVAARVEEIEKSRSLAWVLGTSLGFEAAVLLIASWVFARRDF